MPEAVSVDTIPTVAPIGHPKGLKAAANGVSMAPSKSMPDILDIRRSVVETNLKADVLSMFDPDNGPRELPTLLLYNERGLQLFEDVGLLL